MCQFQPWASFKLRRCSPVDDTSLTIARRRRATSLAITTATTAIPRRRHGDPNDVEATGAWRSIRVLVSAADNLQTSTPFACYDWPSTKTAGKAVSKILMLGTAEDTVGIEKASEYVLEENKRNWNVINGCITNISWQSWPSSTMNFWCFPATALALARVFHQIESKRNSAFMAPLK